MNHSRPESELQFLHECSTPLAVATLVVDLAIDEQGEQLPAQRLADAQKALADLKKLFDERRDSLAGEIRP